MDIAVVNSPKQRGVKTFEDFSDPSIKLCHILSLSKAIETKWTTDAHFCGYFVVDEEGNQIEEAWPRITKQSVPVLHECGYDVMVRVLSVDWDTEGHLPWDKSKETPETFMDAFMDVCEKYPWMESFCCIYYTRAGARIVYQLDEPVSIQKAEEMYLGIASVCRASGFEVDELHDWTRLFRLPSVIRDDSPSWKQEYFYCDVADDVYLPAKKVPLRAVQKKSYTASYSSDTPKPTYDEAVGIMQSTNTQGRTTMTAFAKSVGRALKNNEELHDICFASGQIAPAPGPGRNTNMTSVAGALCKIVMRGRPYVEPKHIYALMLPAVQQFDPDPQQGAEWEDVLWDICVRIFAVEQAQQEESRRQYEAEQERKREEAEESAQNAFEWIDSEELGNEEVLEDLQGGSGGKKRTVEEAVSRIAIAIHNSLYYIMKPDGRYSAKAVKKDAIVSEIEILGSEMIIPLWRPSADGDKQVKRNVQEILDAHGITIEYIKRKFMEPHEGGYIEGLLSESPVLWFCLDSRNPRLEAKFDEFVDQWIHHLDPSGKLEEWLSYAPAVDQGAICGFFIIGPPSIGKNVLVQGLAECFTNATTATGKDLTTQFNENLKRTCVVSLNEAVGSKKQAQSGSDVDAAFRDLITSGVIHINEKHKSVQQVYNLPRIIGTANNKRLVSDMFPSQTTDTADRDAILERLLYIQTDDSAAKYLRELGGENFTGKKGNRWIKSRQGGRSDYVVARHILWLYENRGTPEGIPPGNSRLLVEGSLQAGTSEMHMMSNLVMASSSSKTAVNEALIHAFMMGHKSKVSRQDDGLVIDYDNMEFWVTAMKIRDILKGETFRDIYKVPDVNMVASHLSTMSDPDVSKSPIVHPKKVLMGRLVWFKIDLLQLASFASDIGTPAAFLQEFAEDSAEWEKEKRMQQKCYQ